MAQFIVDSDYSEDCPEAVIGRFYELTCCTQVHRHDFFSLVWLGQGQAELFVDFQYYKLKKGALVCIAPGQVHAWKNLLDGYEIGFGFNKGLYLKQNQQFPEFLYSLQYKTDTPFIQDIPVSQYSLFEFVFRTALERCNAEESPRDYEETLLTYLNVALLEMQRLQTAPFDGQDILFDAPSRLVHDFMDSVENHYLERKKVYEFAEILGVTANHLVQTVREKTEKTPGKIITERLILEAKRQLIHTTNSITEVAFALSFISPSQFTRWFKNEVGLTPGQFRQGLVVFVKNP